MTTPTQSQIRDALDKLDDHILGCDIKTNVDKYCCYLNKEEFDTINHCLQSALDTQKPAGDAAYDFSASKAYVKKNHSLLSDAALIIKAEKSAAITRDSAEALAALDGCWEICDESNLPYVNPDNATEFVNRYSSVIRAALNGDCGGEDIIDRLKDACNGHPHAKIAWPHRLLHDAVEQIEILRCGAFNYQKHIEAQDKEIGGLKLTISLQAKELADRGHLKTTGDSFEDRVRTALYPTGVKHPQQATTDNMIREIVMLVGLHLKTTVEDEKGVDLTKCPCCDGPADNGHDRCFPPNPYNCTKCEEAITHDVSPSGVVDLDAIEDELAEQIKREYPKNWRAVETGMLIGVRHLASTGRISGWLPIESAPMDGTRILVWSDELYMKPYIAWWGVDQNTPEDGNEQEEWLTGDGDSWSTGYYYTPCTPTHWMPLPQPPEVNE